MIALLLAGGLALAEEPEPGLVPADIVLPGEIVYPPREGDARAALQTFLDAHGKHRRGDTLGAMRGYLAFLGTPGRLQLPHRYVTTVQERLEPLLREVSKEYDAAVASYTENRQAGLAALARLAERYDFLPEGRAARALMDSDALREAIDRARAQKDRKNAAKDREKAARDLEQAIKRHTAALYMYEAKTLLVELGGPDLFDKGRRVKDGDAEPEEGGEEKEEKEEEIEVSEDD